MTRLTHTLILLFISLSSTCAQSGSTQFWAKLNSLCGKVYEGVITEGKDNPAFKDKKLLMHVRSCDNSTIRIPFFVGEDRSRTWVLTYEKERIELRHDHRHEDGSEDKITQYGGPATNAGLPDVQVFPADVLTATLIPQAATNIWWITFTETHFSYNLKRMGSDRLFTVKFDLSKPISEIPTPPWGWKN